LQLLSNPIPRPNPNPQCFVWILNAPQIIESGFWHDVLDAIFSQNNGMQTHDTDLTIKKTIHQQAAEKVMAKRVVRARVMAWARFERA
jgi:hypothetical protein